MDLRTSLLSVGHHEVPGQTVVFCNGIMNDEKSALASARLVSSKLSDQKVLVYHNPTTLSHYLNGKQNSSEHQSELAKGLARHIHHSILTSQEKGIDPQHISVTLFVHSHGAVVTKEALKALETLDKTAKNHVSVHAFGGATLIPNRLASKVHNYVFDQDLISDLGNAWETEGACLYQVKKIAKLMEKEKIDLQTAIRKQAAKEVLIPTLDPVSATVNLENSKTQESKNERDKIATDKLHTNRPCPQERYEKKVAQYTALFKEYPITIIRGTSFSKPTFQSLQHVKNQGVMMKIKVILNNLFKGAFACGSYLLKNHAFSEYASLIKI